MEYTRPQTFDNKQSLDYEFANLLKGVNSVHFRTEIDDDLERQALADIEKLRQELEPETLYEPRVVSTPSIPPKTFASQTSMPVEEGVIGTLATRGSRRKRTIGSENSRPNTTPALKPALKPPSAEPRTIASQSTGFEQPRTFTSFTTDESKFSKLKEDNESNEFLKMKLLESQLHNLISQKERMLNEQRQRFETQLHNEIQLHTKDYESNLSTLKE